LKIKKQSGFTLNKKLSPVEIFSKHGVNLLFRQVPDFALISFSKRGNMREARRRKGEREKRRSKK
jgi:hypothetical protein